MEINNDHDFEEYKFPYEDLYNNISAYRFNKSIICKKCNIIIAKRHKKSKFDYFFLNGKEIFEHIFSFEHLNLTCEDIIIKTILE